MKKRHVLAFAATVVGVLLFIVILGVLLLRYGFQSHYDIRKYSLAYFLLVDVEICDISNISIIKQSEDISFTSKAQDGTAPAIDIVSITTPDFIRAKEAIETYVKSQGYVERTQCDPKCNKIWKKGEASIDIYTDKNRLTVEKWELSK